MANGATKSLKRHVGNDRAQRQCRLEDRVEKAMSSQVEKEAISEGH
jgi:hypothetical protein